MLEMFSKKRNGEDWSVVHNTRDAWEAEVVRAALLSENIRARVRPAKGGDRKNRQNFVSVPVSRVKEAQMVIRRTSVVISQKEEIVAEQDERALQGEVQSHEPEQPEAPEMKPTGEPVLLAKKDDVGKIFHYEAEDTYELRLEMESYKQSHFMSGEEWEEFIDFSAQRQEFFILLKDKFPLLAALVKENKMRASFLKLIEYSYGGSQPPSE